MKRLFPHLFRFTVILSICSLLLPGTVLLSPVGAQAFGSLSENGTAAFMGIGINPAKILHVSGTGPGTVPLFQRASDSAGFIIERTPTNRWVLGVNESPTLGNGFVLSTIPTGTTSVPRLMITPTGNVGIGTVSPSSKLHVLTNSNEAIFGRHNTSGNYGYLGGNSYGVYGDGYGSNHGVHGASDNGSGVYGHGRGALGKGVYGSSSSSDGVYGWSNTGDGVRGSSNSGAGAGGQSDSGVGVYGWCGTGGIFGYTNGTGVSGEGSAYGVYGNSMDGIGVFGHSGNSIGVYGRSENSSSYAGYFEGPVKVAGSFATAYRAVSGNCTADAGDSIIDVSAPWGDVTVSLPSAAGIAGRSYTIKRTDAPGYTVRIQADGTETIDGQATQGLGARWAFKTVVSDGSNWLIVGEKL